MLNIFYPCAIDTCSLHEPPRRVQIPLPHGNVSLSDYLFPGEGAQEAQMSFQDVLDVQIATKHAIKDPEGQAGNYSNEKHISICTLIAINNKYKIKTFLVRFERLLQ